MGWRLVEGKKMVNSATKSRLKMVESSSWRVSQTSQGGISFAWLVLWRRKDFLSSFPKKGKLCSLGVVSSTKARMHLPPTFSRIAEQGGSSLEVVEGSYTNSIRKACSRMGKAIWIQSETKEVQSKELLRP
ncbi:hypothetical protein AAG906_039545 [Vitis piasezkii]